MPVIFNRHFCFKKITTPTTVNLTKGEYTQFNLKSRLQLLDMNGLLLVEKEIDEYLKVKLFQIFDFYVEVVYDSCKRKILRAEPVISSNWLDFYKKK